ncbi:MAG: thioredoxin family protein [Bacteroidota bacterium]|nr:thioredoxin family protein [Bacteroidota bacterium]
MKTPIRPIYIPNPLRRLLRLAVVACALMSFTAGIAPAQERAQLYDPGADAAAELDAVIARADAEGKHVLAQVGGNWCRWCVKLDRMMSEDPVIDSLLQVDYILLRINYSKENRNMDVLERLAWPQRFGFPVLVVLDGAGVRLHTQDSGLLESGDGHDPAAVSRFLRLWSPGAIATERDAN